MAIEFYVDSEKKVVNPELFSSVAQRIAKEIEEDRKPKSPENHQVRRFYEDLLSIRRRIERVDDEEEEFKRQLPYIRMAQAKAAYAFRRRNINRRFQEFIEEVARIETMKDFRVFCTLFEAVIAFYRR